MVPLQMEPAMKNYILMTLISATALSPMAVSAAEVAPRRAEATQIGATAGFQRNEDRAERRAERQAARGQDGQRAGGNVNRAERQERRAERRQAAPAQNAPAQVERQQNRAERRQAAPVQTNRAERQAEVYRGERQQGAVRTQRREASQDGRYYDRNRDGNLDRRWDQNRDGNLDRNYDRNRDGRLDRRLDRNDDERIDRRYDQHRNGQIDRRYDRNNDNRLDRRSDSGRADRWSNNWRNDSRYDWRGHRQRYSNYYRPGRYYSPYRGHNYSRISIGFSLGSGYYGSRYWINDPWQYRLPAAYGSYRWIRYYDDVLLVDLRTGRVVDVIRDFFW